MTRILIFTLIYQDRTLNVKHEFPETPSPKALDRQFLLPHLDSPQYLIYFLCKVNIISSETSGVGVSAVGVSARQWIKLNIVFLRVPTIRNSSNMG